tara:strand:+ start:1342 stop:1671 length:330 start_codon:yes stop_codon:yes gene_type:complete
LAFSAALHCLLGCGIGEIAGMIIGTALGMANVNTLILTVVLGIVFGLILEGLQNSVNSLRFKCRCNGKSRNANRGLHSWCNGSSLIELDLFGWNAFGANCRLHTLSTII